MPSTNNVIDTLNEAIATEIQRVQRGNTSSYHISLDDYMNVANTWVASEPVRAGSEPVRASEPDIDFTLDWGEDSDDESYDEDEDIEYDEDRETPPTRAFYSNPFSARVPRSNRQSQPQHNLERLEMDSWDYDTSEESINRYFNTVEYRLKWIFDSEEREGFVRRQVQPFSLQDFERKASKQKHTLNNDKSIFYDWKLGGVDFLVRLEKFEQDGNTYLRVHIFDKQHENKQLCYLDKVWNGQKFASINHQWAGRV